MIENHPYSLNGWVMRIHKPQGVGPFPVMLMLHGWTGDESSMWVFASRLPQNTFMIAPRGLYPAPSGGYSWHPPLSKPWPSMLDLQPAAEKILATISPNNFPDGDFSELHLLGFSQGTALAYALTIIHPERAASLAGLSGFLPEEASAWLAPNRLVGLPVFIAHGTRDELVPVKKARSSARLLEQAGAVVTYCEDDVEHKLSANCFHGLEAFYKRIKT